MADDTVKGNGQFPILRALNFSLPRSFSFTIPVGGKGFTNLFFRLLDFSSKNAEIF